VHFGESKTFENAYEGNSFEIQEKLHVRGILLADFTKVSQNRPIWLMLNDFREKLEIISSNYYILRES